MAGHLSFSKNVLDAATAMMTRDALVSWRDSAQAVFDGRPHPVCQAMFARTAGLLSELSVLSSSVFGRDDPRVAAILAARISAQTLSVSFSGAVPAVSVPDLVESAVESCRKAARHPGSVPFCLPFCSAAIGSPFLLPRIDPSMLPAHGLAVPSLLRAAEALLLVSPRGRILSFCIGEAAGNIACSLFAAGRLAEAGEAILKTRDSFGPEAASAAAGTAFREVPDGYSAFALSALLPR